MAAEAAMRALGDPCAVRWRFLASGDAGSDQPLSVRRRRAGDGVGTAAPPSTPHSRRRRPGGRPQVTITYCNHEQARITEPPRSTGRPPPPSTSTVAPGSRATTTPAASSSTRSAPPWPPRASWSSASTTASGRDGHWPDQIVDVKCAIRYLRANASQLHIDPNEIGAWGQSAGGHLVALLGTAGPSAGWDVGAYPTSRARSRRSSTWPGRATCSPWATRATPARGRELRRAPRTRAAQATRRRPEAASPVTYVSARRPTVPAHALDQRRDRLPPAVARDGLGPRRPTTCPTSSSWWTVVATSSTTPARTRRRPASSPAIVEFFVQHADVAPARPQAPEPGT